jgi:hypothetical protein
MDDAFFGSWETISFTSPIPVPIHLGKTDANAPLDSVRALATQSLVELHGGQVTAHSEGLGKGSSLTVILPDTSAPLPADRPVSQDLEPRGR